MAPFRGDRTWVVAEFDFPAGIEKEAMGTPNYPFSRSRLTKRKYSRRASVFSMEGAPFESLIFKYRPRGQKRRALALPRALLDGSGRLPIPNGLQARWLP